jgi:hypothetical protein
MATIATITRDDTLVPELVGVPTPFFILATVTFIARMIIRFRRKKVGLDDAFLAAAMVRGRGLGNEADVSSQCSAIGYYIVYIVDIANHAMGRHEQFVSASGMSIHARCSFFINEFYVWTVAFVKISLACMLLRIQPAKSWRIGLLTIVGIIVLYSLACSLVNYLQCHPVRAYWDFSYPRDDCLPLEVFRDWVYGGSCM